MTLRARHRRRLARRALRAGAAVVVGVALIALVVHVRTPPLPEGDPPPGAIRVVTYNIRAGLDGLDGVAEDLAPWRADVVALQEVERGIHRSRSVDQPGHLGEALGLEAAFAGSFPAGGGEHGLAILSRHPVGDVTTIRLPRGSGKWPRVALTARIEAPEGTFRFVCVHLARPWGWPLSNTATRLAQIDALMDALADEPLPVVLAGDFNSLPVSPEAWSMARRWTSSWRPWRDGWGSSFDLRAVGLPAGAVNIDHVFHPRSWRSLGHWVGPRGASDHRPVATDLVPPRSGEAAGDAASSAPPAGSSP